MSPGALLIVGIMCILLACSIAVVTYPFGIGPPLLFLVGVIAMVVAGRWKERQ